MRDARRWIGPAAIIAVALALLAVDRVANPSPPPPEPPPGWRIVRPPHEVSALAIRGDTVWAGGQEGVFRIDRPSGRLDGALDVGAPLAFVRALAVDGGGRLWIGHAGGVTVWDGSSASTSGVADGLPDTCVNALLVARDGSVWAGTCGGAARWDGERWRALTSADGLLVDHVNVLFEDDAGGMWFGSAMPPRGGLSLLAEGRWRYVTTGSGLPHNGVTSIVADGVGGVWVGTGFVDRGGACPLARGASGWEIARVLGAGDGLAGAKVRYVFPDGEATWVCSEYDGVAILGQETRTVVTERDGLSSNEVKQVVEDADGTLWLATRDGVTRIEAAARPAAKISAPAGVDAQRRATPARRRQAKSAGARGHDAGSFRCRDPSGEDRPQMARISQNAADRRCRSAASASFAVSAASLLDN